MPRKKILIVDDDFSFSRMLTWMTHNLGYDAISVNCPSSALKLVSGQGVDLVLLDLSLGSESGWDILGMLREQSDIPVIMMTGGDVSEFTVFDAHMKGAQGVLGKPFDAKLLGGVLGRLLDVQQA